MFLKSTCFKTTTSYYRIVKLLFYFVKSFAEMIKKNKLITTKTLNIL
jgi:hypothetical protein